MKFKSLTFGFLTIAICSASSGTPRVPLELEKLIKSQFVAEDVFLAIHNGAPFPEVRKTLGSAVRHEFTVTESGHQWTLIKCFLHTGDEEAYVFYRLLFRDGVLAKTIGSVRWETEEYPTMGTTATRRKPWDIEDMTPVRKALNAPAVTADQIRAEIKDARETMEKYKGKGGIPAMVIEVLAPAFIKQAEKEYPINEDLCQRYDGCRAALGMSFKEVEALYGEPVHVFSTKTGHPVRIYGDHRHLDMDHFVRFSEVAVLFDLDEHAASIYSDVFFNDDWDPGMAPEQHQ